MEGMSQEEAMERRLKLFRSELKVINVGLETFYKDLARQGVKVVHVRWSPPPKLEKELEEALDKLL